MVFSYNSFCVKTPITSVPCSIRLMVCEFHTHRGICHIFHHILYCHTHMPCRTTGNNINLLKSPNFIFGNSHSFKINRAIFDQRIQGILNRFWLPMNFLHHKMFKSSLFCRFRIPLNSVVCFSISSPSRL